MFNNKKRALLVIFAIVLVLTASIGGTLAYITTKTNAVENVFKPVATEVTVTDTVSGNVKKDVVITNECEYDAYIRAAIVANWRDADGNIVAPWTIDSDEGTFANLPGSGWVKYGDYYYYTSPVAEDAEVPNKLFTSYTVNEIPEGAAYLEMDILVQSVQSNPAQAVKDVWGVIISENSVSAAN